MSIDSDGKRTLHDDLSTEKVTKNYDEYIDEDDDGDSNWSLVSHDEEDFIVFSFGEDGDFDVANKEDIDNQKSSSENRPVNRKLDYEQNIKIPNGDGDDVDRWIDSDKKESDDVDEDDDDFEDRRKALRESTESTHSSAASTTSFAFPSLGWDQIGSPERMPGSEGLRIRKCKFALFVGFPCCRP